MSEIRMPDYSVHGAGDTTLFLLHGAYGAKEYWRYQIETFAGRGYRVVAWDAPGYGISPVPQPYTIEHCARALGALLQATGTGRNVVLGHSMGGMVAQQAWELFPGHIHGLVLSATAHTYNHSGKEWQENFVRTRVAPLTAGKTIPEYAPAMLRTMMGPNASGPAVDLVLETVKRMNTDNFRAAIAAIGQYFRDDIPATIRVPTLCIAGELDETCPPRVLKTIANLIPGASYHCMLGCGHFGWAERAEEYDDQVMQLLARVH